jgi:acetyltransferase-like isoleucine patch superfamily enzyme
VKTAAVVAASRQVRSDRSKLVRAIHNAAAALAVAMGYLWGQWYKCKYFILCRTRVRIGKRLRVHGGRLEIRGPGRVHIGDDCTIAGTVTPYTHSDEALLSIGNRVVLNGTRFGCCLKIQVGDDALLSDARIMDSDFHAIDPKGQHRWQTKGKTKPVLIGDRAWIGAGAMILKGVMLQCNTIVAAGAVVTEDTPGNVIVAGNPARVVKDLGSNPPVILWNPASPLVEERETVAAS